jgi:hypothetical protein
MRGERGEGAVVGALCSPANQFTQYWIRKSSGERFWATLKDLKPLPWTREIARHAHAIWSVSQLVNRC